MKIVVLVLAVFTFYQHNLFAQQNKADKSDSLLDKFRGTYQSSVDAAEKFFIKKQAKRLVLAVANHGQTDLAIVSGTTYKPKQVKPAASIEFVADSTGNINKFLWHQDLDMEWKKVQEPDPKTPVINDSIAQYAGRYKTSNTNFINIRADSGRLELLNPMGSRIRLKFVSAGVFTIDAKEFRQFFEFTKDALGNVSKLKVTRKGAISFIKISSASEQNSYSANFNDRSSGFNRADSLRGMLTPLRSCYDVLFYGLEVSIDPDSRSVSGSTLIRFRAVEAFDKLQVDLYENMKIQKVLFRNRELTYTREYNAVFINFPNTILKGTDGELTIIYSGVPQRPNPSALAGGFFWGEDRNGKLWAESVCQGAGASLWWPCKDHLSDKPDSMSISITVPKGLHEISNGRLKAKTDLPNNQTRFEWYVSYPITPYNVVINIGDYIHLTDIYERNGDTLTLDYYCLSYNKEKAQQVFNHVKPMLALYEKSFGPYPFPKDGFTLMESIYPMEHQGAVTFGPVNNPVNSTKFDSTDVISTAWHESAHEWWGNSITCKDMADLWIHEAFATYAEVLNLETFYGKDAAMKYLKNQHPGNKNAIIGTYHVNDFHLGDMYSKGVLMLHTLRNAINNDSLWFKILRNLQQQFQYHTVTTEDIISYFNKSSNKDLTPFFDQYLRHAGIPRLSLIFKKNNSTLQAQYKWETEVPGFAIPVKVTTSKDGFEFIYPTNSWQTIDLPGMRSKDFKVDTESFYIDVSRQD